MTFLSPTKIQTAAVCAWGCGQPAQYQFKNNNKTCSDNPAKCPSKRNIASKTKTKNGVKPHNLIENLNIFMDMFKQKHGEEVFNNISWLNVNFINMSSPIKNLYCKAHQQTFSRCNAYQFLNNSSGGCNICSTKLYATKHKLTIETIMKQFLIVHGEKRFNNIDWSSALYVKKQQPIKNLYCKKHNYLITSTAEVLLRNSSKIVGCKICRHESQNHYQKEKRFKNTKIFYQSSLELNWIYNQYNTLGKEEFEKRVKNGPIIPYIKPNGKKSIYKSDFLLNDNTLIEIKSLYTWFSWHGVPQEEINIAKLNAALVAGYEVILVLDGEEIYWPACILNYILDIKK